MLPSATNFYSFCRIFRITYSPAGTNTKLPMNAYGNQGSWRLVNSDKQHTTNNKTPKIDVLIAANPRIIDDNDGFLTGRTIFRVVAIKAPPR